MGSLEEFVDDILKEKGADRLDPALHERMKKDLLRMLEDTINQTMVDQLSDADFNDLNKIINVADEKTLQSFFAAKIPKLEELIAGVMVGFRESYLGK